MIWLYVLCVIYVAGIQVHEGKRQAASDTVQAESRQREAEIQRLRAELDRFPDRRRAVLESAVIELRKHVAASHETLERVLVFGDPATAPADVVVWVVLSVRPEYGWRSFSQPAKQPHHVLNSHLRRNGYPVPIALGFAPTADVDRVGGDEAYCGRDGLSVIPRFPLDTDPGARSRPLEVPRR